MSPTAFGYALVLTTLLAVAAMAVDWGARGRGISRHFWTAAIVLGVLSPPLALAWSAAERNGTGGQAMGRSTATPMAAIVVWSGRPVAHAVRHFVDGRAIQKLEFASLGIWAALSLVLAVWMIVGVLYWRRTQRAWRPTTLDGVDVDVSLTTGPAVLGLWSHRIVLPEWATTLPPEQRRLVLAHECEHISAGDPERLALAVIALILMPWNIALWWCAARLRRAIEFDCDARVLKRFPSTKEYGYVLLEVAKRGRNAGPLAIPMVGLLRLPSGLERRLRAMTLRHRRGARGAALGGIIALGAIGAAFTTPVPILRHSNALASTRQQAIPVLVRVATASLKLNGAGVDAGHYGWLGKLSADAGAKERHDSTNTRRMQHDSLARIERELTLRRLQLAEANATLESTYVARIERESTLSRILLPGSPAPQYPAALRSAGIAGEVDAQFVVDTTGRVDTSTIKITKSTNLQFAQAVRTALPLMRFIPAEGPHGRRVRQLLQQPFTFNISH